MCSLWNGVYWKHLLQTEYKALQYIDFVNNSRRNNQLYEVNCLFHGTQKLSAVTVVHCLGSFPFKCQSLTKSRFMH